MGHHKRLDEELDQALSQIGRSVAGPSQVFSIGTAQKAGIPKEVVRNLLTSQRLHKIRHGAYVDKAVWMNAQDDQLLMRRLLVSAAMIGLRQAAFAYGQVAAELHDLPTQGSGPTCLEIVRQQGSDLRSATSRVKARNRLDDVRILGRDLGDEPVTYLHGIPTIGLASAALTAAAQFRREYAIGVFDSALGSGIERSEFSALVQRWKAGKGVLAASRLVPDARPGSESILESVSRVRLMDRGIPEPVLQHSFSDGRGFVGRVDFWWPKLRVVGEADGMGKYADIRDLRAEKVREDRLRALGMTVVRWTWEEIWSSPMDIVARIHAGHRR